MKKDLKQLRADCHDQVALKPRQPYSQSVCMTTLRRTSMTQITVPMGRACVWLGVGRALACKADLGFFVGIYMPHFTHVSF
jgi:hypothetical protein